MKSKLSIVLILLITTGALFAKGRQEDTVVIDIPGLEKLIAGGELVILDIRDEASYLEGHIPGAVLVPYPAVKGAAESLRGIGVPVITYCSCPAEESSMAAALDLMSLGVEGVQVLVGGYLEWIRLDKPIIKGPAPF